MNANEPKPGSRRGEKVDVTDPCGCRMVVTVMTPGKCGIGNYYPCAKHKVERAPNRKKDEKP